ncbi:beta-ketoacyl synthase [Talaromyces proteolyticus]|uniref:Beta-ketoacyl synthase n=1 Tax=Talaromyces proteolyticus TaxID=1131652 RepID=A0AAD4PT94_9EURO|nr:beta-ketoacyl synthase [Talaromyces proteolyticus]KAH8690471.1 beta-ketoacyl synthase [Talaromyces proteolyticus]
MRRLSQEDRLNVVLLGDQTSNVSSLLRKLLLDAPHSVSQSEFIRDASAALKGAYDRLRPFQREKLPLFKNVHELAKIYQEGNGECHPSIASALLCVTQLLQIFRYFEGRGRRPENNENITVVGLCTGSLVAAAYAASASLDDLKVLAVPTVSMAFQMGLQAATASSMLHEQIPPLRSWSISIPKMTEDEALSALQIYDAGGHLSLRHRCFVSAVGLNSITISGAPPALSRFSESLTASKPNRKPRPLPIFSAYHASHIHTVLDFRSFLQRSGIDPELLACFESRKTILSPLTGLPIESNNALGIFENVVCQTMQAPLRLDLITSNCISYINENNISSVNIDIIGPAPISDSFASTIRSGSKATVSTRDLIALEPGVDEYRPSAAFHRAPLAVVGVSGRFPGADSVESLWNVLEQGLDLHRVVPKDRFDQEKHVDPTGKTKNTSWTPYGCFIERPGDFDPRFFNMSPREALQTDPMQRLALVTAYEALEMSGFVPGRTRSTSLDRVSTFYGQTSDDYRDVNSAQDIGTYFITGGIRAFGPGRINYFFKFRGPSYNVDTACSSSLAAIQLACTSLWSGECDTAVAGGLSVLTSPDLFSGLSRGQFLSKTGSCKTFDNDADGYCRADGIGSVVIKRLADAELDRDNILTVILGAGTNHSADAVSITHPHAETQSTLYRDILQQSGVDPLDVGYIEMHGTGTQAGDGTEMRSVVDVFAPARPVRSTENPLYVGAIKANIGHGEASSGVASLIKSILIFKHNVIPPHVGIKNTINKDFPDLKARNVRIARTKTSFPQTNEKRRTILVNNFSAAGGNTALLIQEPPNPVIENSTEPRPLHAVSVSGHTVSAAKNNLERLIAYLSTNHDVSPIDLSYTTTARRRHHRFRLTVTGSSIDSIKTSLEQKRQSILSAPSTPEEGPSIVFVFTGQGTAFPALAYELYKTSSQFRADIDHFDGIARQQGFPTFLPIIDGSVMDLNSLSPIQTQIGLVCVQVALARLWSSWGVKPTAVLGHSLGEYAALQLSSVLSISDVIFLVGYRARLLETKCEMHSHSMLAVADSPSVLQSVPSNISSRVEIACVNSPSETVFASDKHVIDQLESYFVARGLRCTKLPVPFAFHSAQVDPILDDLEEVASVTNIGAPQIPVISSLFGRILGPKDPIGARYLRRHCREAVQFSSAVTNARDAGLINDSTVFIEVGPHPVCSGMLRSILGNNVQALPTLRRKESPWKVIVGSLASLHDMGFPINWFEYHRDFEKTCRLLTLPAYAFDNKNYWIEYRNDWTLRKGDPLPASHVQNATRQPPKQLPASVHRVVVERYRERDAVAIFETDLSATAIYSAITGHRVNGATLCPSSIYADVALTIADYIQNHPQSGFTLSGHNISSMEVHQPLIIKSSKNDEDRVLRVYARLDQAPHKVKLFYVSVSPDQETETEHATCVVEFEDPEKWLRRWTHEFHLIQDRIKALEALSECGEVSKIATGLAYRLFSSFVDYSPNYRRMERVLLAGGLFEAAANVNLNDRGDDLAFFCSPYWIDALLHISGFVLNANDSVDHEEAAYISHGWETLRFAKAFNPSGNYKTYVRMLPGEKKMMEGNVWILCDEQVVGLVENIRFQRVPRTVLNILLPRLGKDSRPANKAVKSIVKHTQERKSDIIKPSKTESNGRQGGDSFLDLIASELGLASSEILPHDNLSDLGVDSLMSLTLAGRLMETFGLDISHNELMAASSIMDLLGILRQKASGSLQQPINLPNQNVSDNSVTAYRSPGSSETLEPPSFTPASNSSDIVELTRSVILEETGFSAEELEPSTPLSTLGVDSLMSLTVLGRLRESGVELPADFFIKNVTMEEVVQSLSSTSEIENVPNNPIAIYRKEPKPLSPENPRLDSKENNAKVVLLQRRVELSSTKTLFLFPDGSGSPFAYAALGQISKEFDVYGLVCPFINTPENYVCGIEATVRMYLRTIKATQPTGPYYFGGWSVGGVLAFEASKQLVEVGDLVPALFLIDSPCPTVVPPMPTSLIKFLDSIGLFDKLSDTAVSNSGDNRQVLLKHFDATVSNLSLYKPSPICPASAAPQTFIVWAQEGVLKDYEGPNPVLTPPGSSTAIEDWILDDRTNFGSRGWETLLPLQAITAGSVPGNHFTMMATPNISKLSSHLQGVVSAL